MVAKKCLSKVDSIERILSKLAVPSRTKSYRLIFNTQRVLQQKVRIVDTLNKKTNKKIDMAMCALGKSDSHIDFVGLEKPVHQDVRTEIAALKQSASDAGFDLRLASGFRSFDQQLTIWNDKVNGVRPVLDANEIPIDVNTLAEKDVVFSILRWSALPGTSRHHWGTDVDVYDASAMPEGYSLQLTVKETLTGGVFESFYIWLDNMLCNSDSGFYRPYALDRGGVSPEPWHLSYRPLADNFAACCSVDAVVAQLTQSDIALKHIVIANIEEIFDRFVVR